MFALFPRIRELNVIQSAFRSLEKGFVTPSPTEAKLDVTIFQSSKSDYFEQFVSIKRPLTPEEVLEGIIKERGITKLSELISLGNEMPAARQAMVKVELGGTRSSMRLGEIPDSLAKSGISLILVSEDSGASVRVRKAKVEVDSQGVHSLVELLTRRHLNPST